MTKSQNTKNEQQKDLCITSEQLTEQWKKGELPDGRYWVKTKTWCECIDMLYYTSDIFLDGDVPVDNDQIIEVLAEVPTFDELEQLKEYERIVTSYNMKPIDYDIACETVNKLLDDNKRLKHDVGNLGYKIKNQRHEIERQIAQNAQLKERVSKLKKMQYSYTPEEWNAMLRTVNRTKALLKECELWFTGMVGNMNDKNVGEHNKSVPIGNFEYIFKEFSQKINEVLK